MGSQADADFSVGYISHARAFKTRFWSADECIGDAVAPKALAIPTLGGVGGQMVFNQ